MLLFLSYLKFYVVPFLIISTVLLILVVLLKRVHYEHSKPIRELLGNTIEIFLTEMILSNPLDPTLKAKRLLFEKAIPLHKTWCKEMTINDMIRFKMNLKGKAAEQINILYESFRLHKYSAGLIKKNKSFYKCEGFYHFQALDHKKGSALIEPYIKDPNPIIRSNANMAFISLSENHMESLKDLHTTISYLNIIKIMDILHQNKIVIPGNIDQWLTTNNTSVKIVGLKIMVFYNYRNQSKEIIALLKDENDIIIKEAILTIRELFLVEAKTDLIQLFYSVTTEIQLEILATLKIIGDQSIIPFLDDTIQTRDNNDVKLKAIECLNEIDKTKLDIIAAQDFEITKMAQHVREIYLS